mgnify:CR=1 FL=1
MLTMANMQKNKRYTIKSITENGMMKQKLLFMGLTPGAQVRLLSTSPLGDPMAFEVRTFTLSLRRKEAEKILVEEQGGSAVAQQSEPK